MGILDGFQFDPQSYGPQGILGMLAQNGMGLPLSVPQAAPQPQLPPQLPPTDVSAAQVMPQAPAAQQGGLGGILSSLGSLFGPSQANAGELQQGPQGPAGGHLGAALANFAGSRGLLPALSGAITGGLTGQRTDPAGMMLQQQQATYQALVPALVNNGLPLQQARAVAQAAALNPDVMKSVAPQLASKGQVVTTTDEWGRQHINLVNPFSGTASEITPGGGTGNGMDPAIGQVVGQIDAMRRSGASQEQMLQAIPQAYRPFIQGMLDGRGLPTSLGMRGKNRENIMLMAQAMGLDEGQLKARMEFANDIGNTKSGLGFRLEAGGKVLNHLEGALDTALKLHNLDVPSGVAGYLVPGAVVQGLNAVGNNPAEQRNIAKQFETEAGSMALEKGRFLGGPSGGSMHEREKTVEAYNPNAPRSNLAGAAQGDLDLMKGQYGSMITRRDNLIGVNSDAKKFQILTPQQEAQMERIQKKIDMLKAGEGGGGAQQQAAVPPPADRKVGQTYQTPKGPAVWRGTGWELVR